MLETVMAHINNYFCKDVVRGTFKIEGGAIASFDALNGQYIRIVGSVLNDGVYQWPVSSLDLIDEEFSGEIWRLAVPKAFLSLCSEIGTWCETNGTVAGAFTSESFGGYSYSRASNGDGGLVTWQDSFNPRLRVWRKLP